ncbi:unnamed protein product [Agarophyton chilense]|eukprot:gb/GEZJ01004742.1/.p1 GENE.gb/GEZJ01004742.1/~~gb/GEZJ01004742.1/.p1  ORF type:complete len:562 (-),score=41.26 gb/GEZJ01004742.1/:1139-2824(-)
MSELSPNKIAVVETPLGGTVPLQSPAIEEHGLDDSLLPPKVRSLKSIWCQPRPLMRYHYNKVDYVGKPSTSISCQDSFHIIVALSQLAIFLPLRKEAFSYTLCERTLLLFWPLATFARIQIMFQTLWPAPNDVINLFYKLIIGLFILTYSLTVHTAFSKTRIITALSASVMILIPSVFLLRQAWYEPLLKDVSNRANQLALHSAAHVLVATPYFASIFVSSMLGVKTLYWSGFVASMFVHFAPHAAFFWLHRGRRRAQTHIPPRLFSNYEDLRLMSRACYACGCFLILVHGNDLVYDPSTRLNRLYGVGVLAFISLISLRVIHSIDTANSNDLNPKIFVSMTSTVLFAVLHFFTLLLSTACAQLMTSASNSNNELSFSTRKLFSVAWACSVLATTILSAFRTRLTNVSRIIRLSIRLVITAAVSPAMAHSKTSPIIFLFVFSLFLVIIMTTDFILERYESHNVAPFVKNGEQFSSFQPYERSVSGMELNTNADLSTVLRILESRNTEGVYPHLTSFKQRLLANDDTRLIPIVLNQDTNALSRQATSISEEHSRPVPVIVLG